MKNPEFPTKTLRSCPLCGSHDFKALGEVFDDRYGYPGRFPVAECEACGLGVLKRQVVPAMLGRLYERYYHRGVAPKPSRRASRSKLKGVAFYLRSRILRGGEIWRWARPGGNVLDVGAGEGWPLPVLALLGSGYTGLEWNSRDCARMKAHGLQAIRGDLGTALKLKRRFDTVAMSQVIEHLPDPVKALRQAAGLLAPGGRLLVTCPNWNSSFRQGLSWLNYHAPYHLWHFNPGTLALAAEKAGLRVLRLRTVSPLGWLAWRHCMDGAQEGRLNECFGKPQPLSGQLPHWPEALMADWRGRGDCLVAELA